MTKLYRNYENMLWAVRGDTRILLKGLEYKRLFMSMTHFKD